MPARGMTQTVSKHVGGTDDLHDTVPSGATRPRTANSNATDAAVPPGPRTANSNATHAAVPAGPRNGPRTTNAAAAAAVPGRPNAEARHHLRHRAPD